MDKLSLYQNFESETDNWRNYQDLIYVIFHKKRPPKVQDKKEYNRQYWKRYYVGDRVLKKRAYMKEYAKRKKHN